jgi:hypothetical protein
MVAAVAAMEHNDESLLMTTFRVSSAAFLFGLVPVLAFAQSALPDPAVPGSGYRIPERVTQGTALPPSGSCGQTVATLKDSALLRVIRRGVETGPLRNALLDTAASAAAAGDEAGCAYWLNRYEQIP